MKTFTESEELVLNRIQKDLSLTVDPLGDLAKELDIDESEIFEIVKKLKNKKIIRDISAIFNAEKLGYKTSLIAFQMQEEKIESASQIISGHHGVSHNYLRDHKYNIWFTLSVDSETSLSDETKRIARECEALDYLILKNEKLFKIGLVLNIGETEDDSDEDPDEYEGVASPDGVNSNGVFGPGGMDTGNTRKITKEEKKAISILQIDLPLVKRPFKSLLEKNCPDLSEERLVEIGESLKKENIMRRYSAVLKHRNAGFNSNAMTAWKIDIENAGNDTIEIFSSNPNISHLYLRTVYPGKWEYPLFAMIHAKDDKELSKIINDIENKSGIKDYLVLKSIKEFKKKRVKYFND